MTRRGAQQPDNSETHLESSASALSLAERIMIADQFLTLGRVKVNLKLNLTWFQSKQFHIFSMGVYRAQNDEHKGTQKLFVGDR